MPGIRHRQELFVCNALRAEITASQAQLYVAFARNELYRGKRKSALADIHLANRFIKLSQHHRNAAGRLLSSINRDR